MKKRPPRTAPHESGITLAALRTFIAVVEAESFSRAAELLGVSQPSVSIQLHGLERACGVLLLRRRPKPALTDAGRDLFVRARLIVGRLREFEDSVGELRELKRGHLSVGLSGPHVALPLIGAFRRAFPAITLETRIGNTTALLADVGQCRIDVALVALAAPVAGLHCAKVTDLSLALCVPAGDPLARRRSLRPQDIRQRPIIQREDGSFTRRLAEGLLAAARVRPAVAMAVTGREALKEAVVAGLGLGFVFAHEVAGDSRLAAVAVEPSPAAAIYAVALRESLEIPTVRTFIQHVATPPAARG